MWSRVLRRGGVRRHPLNKLAKNEGEKKGPAAAWKTSSNHLQILEGKGPVRKKKKVLTETLAGPEKSLEEGKKKWATTKGEKDKKRLSPHTSYYGMNFSLDHDVLRDHLANLDERKRKKKLKERGRRKKPEVHLDLWGTSTSTAYRLPVTNPRGGGPCGDPQVSAGPRPKNRR